MSDHNAFNSVGDTDTTEQMSLFDTSDTDNDTTADGKTHRVYTIHDKENGKRRIAETLDWCREEADSLRLFMRTFFTEVRAGRKVSANRLSYMALSHDLADHNGGQFSISHNVGPVLIRMIAAQWPEFAALCSMNECVLDCDELAPMIPPLGEVVDDISDLLSA